MNTNSFLKMSNQIFDYKLTPKALRVYAFLLSKMNVFHTVITPINKIAAECRIAPATATSAVNELITHNLLAKRNRFNMRGYLANGYTVTVLPGNWFKVERECLNSEVSTVDFMIFCFIKRCMDTKNENAFPSLRAIARSTGLSKSRIIAGIRYLGEHSCINRLHRRYKRTRAFRHNRYLLFKRASYMEISMKRARSEERALFHLALVTTQEQKMRLPQLIFNRLTYYSQKVKRII